jgi:hypothetical protein
MVLLSIQDIGGIVKILLHKLFIWKNDELQANVRAGACVETVKILCPEGFGVLWQHCLLIFQ